MAPYRTTDADGNQPGETTVAAEWLLAAQDQEHGGEGARVARKVFKEDFLLMGVSLKNHI